MPFYSTYPTLMQQAIRLSNLVIIFMFLKILPSRIQDIKINVFLTVVQKMFTLS